MNAAERIRAAHVVLLDFDGPVTPLMPAPLNAQVTDLVRNQLRSGDTELPRNLIDTTDHLELLRWSRRYAPEALADVERIAEELEVQAAGSCEPTPGSHDFIVACSRTARTVVFVSNNTQTAIDGYLDRWGLRPLITAIIGRQAGHQNS